ncbi:hypothetical protein [Nocardioides massiliensis]|uniref:Portal protein n=1 Tax=Nocardioides massiliensis TaxID=1325935 RepID=A0ABT9NJ82_9ACTN|nr:hypothetical protein [Nocardioides massiliensis]MDP9820476.1 hypothetical protein [Nocardioides massiliensis]
MSDLSRITGRVQVVRARNVSRDREYAKLIAIRQGDYEKVAPGLFNTEEFDRPLVANLIDTTARDIAETMAPVPTVNCNAATLSNASEVTRQSKRNAIANSYIQKSRLQDQMFAGADRYGSFGFMAYIIDPDTEEHAPRIRVGERATAHYVKDYRGNTAEYFEVSRIPIDELMLKYPDHAAQLAAHQKRHTEATEVEVVDWYDKERRLLFVLDPQIVLVDLPSPLPGKCPVRIVERPTITGQGPRGQFDDVIWVQVARALLQMYTMSAIERQVNAPLVVPMDVNEMEIGPFAAIQTDGQVTTVPLQISPALFPEGQVLAQEQRMGSRYPEGRTGSIDASVITGQGIQALNGAFDTQVATFQRLNASAMEDVISMCFEMDEHLWPDLKKTFFIRDNGSPFKLEYQAGKDIAGDYTCDVTYGAIAGLDANRGLIFILQALAGGLVSKQTARKTLPVDINPSEEERAIGLEQMDDSIAAALAALPQAIPQMAMGGMDPRELVQQITEIRKLVANGKSPAEAAEKVFAPKEDPQAEAPAPDPLAEAQAGGAGLPGAGGGGASDMLMMLAGVGAGGDPNMSANVSRMIPM